LGNSHSLCLDASRGVRNPRTGSEKRAVLLPAEIQREKEGCETVAERRPVKGKSILPETRTWTYTEKIPNPEGGFKNGRGRDCQGSLPWACGWNKEKTALQVLSRGTYNCNVSSPKEENAHPKKVLNTIIEKRSHHNTERMGGGGSH